MSLGQLLYQPNTYSVTELILLVKTKELQYKQV